MSTARDTGLAALQSGDIPTAIAQLEAATRENPSDYDACLYLGGAYGQSGRHMDAIKIFTQAVQLQPANAQARYNLGVAMEQGGYEEQALQVYDQAIQLQPDYPKAHEAIKRLEASSNDGFGAPPAAPSASDPDSQQARSSHSPNSDELKDEPAIGQHQQQPVQQYGQPTQAFPQPTQQPAQFGQPTQAFAPPAQQPAQFGQPTQAFPPPAQQPVQFGQPTQAFPPPAQQPAQFGQPTQAFTPPAQQPAQYGQPTQAFTPPAQQPAQFAQPAQAFPQPAAQQPPVEPGLGSYMAPPASTAAQSPFGQSAYGAPAGGYGPRPGAMPYSSGPSYDDDYSIGQGFKDWARALFSPGKLFSEMAGCDTTRSAMGLFTAYMLMYMVAGLIYGFGHMSVSGVPFLIGAVIGSALGSLLLLLVWSIFAGIVHMLSKAFGSSLSYGGSLQCVIYSAAPAIIGAIINLIMMGFTSSPAGVTPVVRASPSSVIRVIPAQYQPSTRSPFGQSPFGGNSGRTRNPYGATGSTSSPFAAGRPNPFASNPIGAIFALIGFLWSIPLLGVAVCHVHQISGGSAAGVVILSVIISIALFIGLCVVIGMIFGAAIMGMASAASGGSPG